MIFVANKVQRIGFIGISGRGSSMLDLLLQVEGVKVPAVCDLVVERAEKGIEIVEERNNKEYPVKAYLDYIIYYSNVFCQLKNITNQYH